MNSYPGLVTLYRNLLEKLFFKYVMVYLKLFKKIQRTQGLLLFHKETLGLARVESLNGVEP